VGSTFRTFKSGHCSKRFDDSVKTRPGETQRVPPVGLQETGSQCAHGIGPRYIFDGEDEDGMASTTRDPQHFRCHPLSFLQQTGRRPSMTDAIESTHRPRGPTTPERFASFHSSAATLSNTFSIIGLRFGGSQERRHPTLRFFDSVIEDATSASKIKGSTLVTRAGEGNPFDLAARESNLSFCRDMTSLTLGSGLGGFRTPSGHPYPR